MILSVLSGKGGTGKTTIVAALSDLASQVIQVDCDVDAPNLFLLYKGVNLEKNDFYAGKKAKINPKACIKCGICEEICKFSAIKYAKVDQIRCEGCGACTLVCPNHAIIMEDIKTADVFLTRTRKNIIARAEMKIGSDGSGKLVTELRKKAKRRNDSEKLTILDGSPGIGCSVIASIADTDILLVVTEPTKSGLSDLKRILKLARNFETSIYICINKYDINLQMTSLIEQYAAEQNIQVIGKIPFDSFVMQAINDLRPITQFEESTAKRAIVEMWNLLKKEIVRKAI